MYQVITIGDVVLDTHIQIDHASIECNLDGKNCKLCLDYAAKVPIHESFQVLGGNSANVAVGLKKLGVKSLIISTVGDDANAEIVKKEIQKTGLQTDYISTDKSTVTRYSIVLNFQGERTILSQHKKRKYFWPKSFPHTDWIYYTSLSEGFESIQDNLVKFLNKHPGVRLAYNPGTFQLKYNLESTKEILAKADLLLVNLEEAQILVGKTLNQVKTITALMRELFTLGAKEVAITDGERGAYAGNKDEIFQMEALPVPVRFKTGAGDAFSSGYLGARVLGHDIAHALTWGIANSCAVIQQFGNQTGLLNPTGIKKILSQYSKNRAEEI